MKMKIRYPTNSLRKYPMKIPVENGKVAKLQKFKVDSARQGNPCLWISWRSEIVGEILRNHMSHICTTTSTKISEIWIVLVDNFLLEGDKKLPHARVGPIWCVPSVRFSYSGSVKAPEMQQFVMQSFYHPHLGASKKFWWKERHEYLPSTLWELHH